MYSHVQDGFLHKVFQMLARKTILCMTITFQNDIYLYINTVMYKSSDFKVCCGNFEKVAKREQIEQFKFLKIKRLNF